jgi:diadenosine tetraphosphate (Ap4A) HIT family hydrolase
MLRKRKAHKTAHKLDTKDKSSNAPCPFCTLGDGADIVRETKYMYVVINRVPYDYFEGTTVEDHLMVVPKAHRRGLAELTEAEALDYVQTLAQYESADYSLYSRGKASKIRSVEHLHTHLLKTPHPRARFIFYLSRPYLNLHLMRKTK